MTYRDDVGGRVAGNDLNKPGGLEAYYAFTLERAMRLQAQRAPATQPLDPCDLIPTLRLFYVFDESTWLLASINTDGDTAFGCIQETDEPPRLGHFSLSELAGRRWHDRCAINLDPDFRTHATLKQWLSRACEIGSILDAEPDLNLNWGNDPYCAKVMSEIQIGEDQPRSFS